MQQVYALLWPLKTWLAEQQDKLDSMRPAAVMTTALSDQIAENEVSHTFMCLSVDVLLILLVLICA